MHDRGPRIFLVFAILAVLAAALMVRHYLAAVVLALTVGFLTHRPYEWLEQHLPRRAPAAFLILFMVAILLLAPLAILALLVYEDAARLIQRIDSREALQDEVGSWLGGLGLSESQVERYGGQVVEQTASFLQGQAVPLFTMATDLLIGLLVFFIVLFFALIDGRALTEYLARTLPAPTPQVERVLERMGERVRAILIGTVGVAVIQGLIAGIGWWVLGLPAPVFWGFVMLILSIVPVIGAFVVLLPAAIWAFVQGDVWVGSGLLVLNFVMVGLVDDVLRPYLIGRSSNVHPALILLGIAGGLPLFGLAGLILGPLLMGMIVPLWEAWAHPQSHPMVDQVAEGS